MWSPLLGRASWGTPGWSPWRRPIAELPAGPQPPEDASGPVHPAPLGLRKKKPVATWTGLGGVAPRLEGDFSDHAASKRRRTQTTEGETGLNLPGGGCEVGNGFAPHHRVLQPGLGHAGRPKLPPAPRWQRGAPQSAPSRTRARASGSPRASGAEDSPLSPRCFWPQ